MLGAVAHFGEEPRELRLVPWATEGPVHARRAADEDTVKKYMAVGLSSPLSKSSFIIIAFIILVQKILEDPIFQKPKLAS